MEGKPFWTSKMLWVNILAVIGLVLVGRTGLDITTEQWAEISGVVLAVVNIVLRFVTGEPLVWSKSDE
jgi:hypothetical protein